jgi:hypothetical protein
MFFYYLNQPDYNESRLYNKQITYAGPKLFVTYDFDFIGIESSLKELRTKLFYFKIFIGLFLPKD